MNPDSPATPREELEARLTALLLGELSADEAASLRQTIAEDAELARLHDRLKQAIELVQEAAASPEHEHLTSSNLPKLSGERREGLLQSFKVIRPQDLERAKRRKTLWREAAALAAMVVGLAALAGALVFHSSFDSWRYSTRSSLMARGGGQIDEEYFGFEVLDWFREKHKPAAATPLVALGIQSVDFGDDVAVELQNSPSVQGGSAPAVSANKGLAGTSWESAPAASSSPENGRRAGISPVQKFSVTTVPAPTKPDQLSDREQLQARHWDMKPAEHNNLGSLFITDSKAKPDAKKAGGSSIALPQLLAESSLPSKDVWIDTEGHQAVTRRFFDESKPSSVNGSAQDWAGGLAFGNGGSLGGGSGAGGLGGVSRGSDRGFGIAPSGQIAGGQTAPPRSGQPTSEFVDGRSAPQSRRGEDRALRKQNLSDLYADVDSDAQIVVSSGAGVAAPDASVRLTVAPDVGGRALGHKFQPTPPTDPATDSQMVIAEMDGEFNLAKANTPVNTPAMPTPNSGWRKDAFFSGATDAPRAATPQPVIPPPLVVQTPPPVAEPRPAIVTSGGAMLAGSVVDGGAVAYLNGTDVAKKSMLAPVTATAAATVAEPAATDTLAAKTDPSEGTQLYRSRVLLTEGLASTPDSTATRNFVAPVQQSSALFDTALGDRFDVINGGTLNAPLAGQPAQGRDGDGMKLYLYKGFNDSGFAKAAEKKAPAEGKAPIGISDEKAGGVYSVNGVGFLNIPADKSKREYKSANLLADDTESRRKGVEIALPQALELEKSLEQSPKVGPVVINEIKTHSEVPLQDDFVELDGLARRERPVSGSGEKREPRVMTGPVAAAEVQLRLPSEPAVTFANRLPNIVNRAASPGGEAKPSNERVMRESLARSSGKKEMKAPESERRSESERLNRLPAVVTNMSQDEFRRAISTASPDTSGPRASTDKEELRRKLDSIRLPELRSDSLPLAAVIESLKQEVAKAAPSTKGINLVLNDRHDSSTTGTAPLDAATGLPVPSPNEVTDLSATTIKIPSPMRNVTLSQALDAISKAADRPINIAVEDYGVVLSSGDKQSASRVAMEPVKSGADDLAALGRQLDESRFVRDRLLARVTQEKVDTALPRSSPVEIVDVAEAQPAKSSTLWERVRGTVAGGVERSARIALEKDAPDIAGLGVEQNSPASFDPYWIQTQFERIQSKPVLERAAEKLNLNEAWAGKYGGGEKLRTEDAVKQLKKMLDVSQVRSTSLIEIKAKSDNPAEAARIANAVAEAYRDSRLERWKQMNQQSVAALERELAEQDKKLAEFAHKLEREKKELKQGQEDAPLPKLAARAAVPQPEVTTTENAFSTFSLNVSDVSFKLAAAALEKGQMPDPATVRSEEFINAFDYRDPEPAGSAPIAFAWERARYPFAHDRDLVRFSVKTAASGRQPGRPLNLVLLLDNSGSMERADRIRIRQECLRVLAGQLQPQDRVSVVAFARTARLWVDGLPGNQAGELPQRVGGLTPEGGTNLEDAMNLAYQTARRHFLAGGVNRVVLLTDGAANLGDVQPESLKKKVEANRQQGIALDCFGIGWEGYNDDLLETLSRNGDGRYGFVNTPEAATTEFAGQLAGALKVSASDVKVQVEWNPRRVTAYRQVGYAKHQLKKEQFRDNTVDAAEIGAAEAGNALYTVQVNPAGEGPLGIMRVRFKVPGTSDYREHEWPLPYEGAAKSLDQSTATLRLAASASAFSEWLVSSPFAAEVTPDKLLGYLGNVPEAFSADPRPKKLEWMIRQAKSVSGK